MKIRLLKRIRKHYSITKIEKFDVDTYTSSLRENGYDYESINSAKEIFELKYESKFCTSEEYFLSYERAYQYLIDSTRYSYGDSSKKEIRTKLWYIKKT